MAGASSDALATASRGRRSSVSQALGLAPSEALLAESGTTGGGRRSLMLEETAAESRQPQQPQERRRMPPGKVSLLRYLSRRMETLWLEGDTDNGEAGWSRMIYETEPYVKRRAPDEIETVLATIDQGALDLMQQSFGSRPLNMVQFTEAIVRTGTYDKDHVLQFLGGIVDLFFEVLRSQPDRAEGTDKHAVWMGQLMNHFIESPEIAMFEGTEVTRGIAAKTQSGGGGLGIAMTKSSLVDSAKHMGSEVQKLYHIPHLESLVTVEGSDSVYLWSPQEGWDAGRQVTLKAELKPDKLPEDCYDGSGRPLFSVYAAAWDPELQDLVALLSNRMLIVFRLRSKKDDRFQFWQRGDFRFCATREREQLGGGERGDPYWKVWLQDAKGDSMKGKAAHQRAAREREKDKKPVAREVEQATMLRERVSEMSGKDLSVQLDVWWNTHHKLWVTTDKKGVLRLWDLRRVETTGLDVPTEPKHTLRVHTRKVTMHLELSRSKFCTCSLDRKVVLWDNRTLCAEMKIQEHTAAVLSVAYLPLYSSLVSVGCEKRIYVWSVDSTAYRGVRAKLTGHQSNLLSVSAGQKVFFTLDESSVAILWDAATLVCLQTFGNASLLLRHILCIPSLGRLCVAGRRFYFYDAGEHMMDALGKVITVKDQSTKSKVASDGASLKEKAQAKYVGLSAMRGTILSVTEVEIRLHHREFPQISRVLYSAPDGDSIADVSVADNLSLIVVGTSKGSMSFLKYRSGFPMRTYPGKVVEETHARSAKDEIMVPGARDTLAKIAAAGSTSEKKMDKVAGSANSSNAMAAAAAAAAAALAARGGNRNTALAAAAAAAAAANGGTDSMGSTMRDRKSGGDGGRVRVTEDPMAMHASAGGELEGDGRQVQDQKEVSRQQARIPTQEDVHKGLTTGVHCVLICEALRIIFAGTSEGHVLCMSLDNDFEFLRCLEQADHDYSPVTCMHYYYNGENGILAVGVREGSAHLYMLPWLRYAGSINIPKILHELDPSSDQRASEALKHMQLMALPENLPVPVGLLAIDAYSHVWLWGLRLQPHSGKLEELVLLCDGGQFHERVFTEPDKGMPPGMDMTASQTSRSQASEPEVSSKLVNLTCTARFQGGVVFYPDVADAVHIVGMPGSSQGLRNKVSASSGAIANRGGDGYSSSGSDNEVDEVVAQRVAKRPRTPPLPTADQDEKSRPVMPVDADGRGLVFLGDSKGCIWCIDVAGSAVHGFQRNPHFISLPQHPAQKGSAKHRTRASLRATLPHGNRLLRYTPKGLQSDKRVDHGEAFKVLTVWPAHKSALLSLATVDSAYAPPALVSTSSDYEVKVWNTTGELWGHFTMRGQDPPVTLWPPPHVLAAQQALMRFSRYLEGRVGLPSKRNKFVLALQYVARLKVMGREMQRKHQLGTPEPVSNLSGGPGGGPMSPSMGGMEDADALESPSASTIAGSPNSTVGFQRANKAAKGTATRSAAKRRNSAPFITATNDWVETNSATDNDDAADAAVAAEVDAQPLADIAADGALEGGHGRMSSGSASAHSGVTTPTKHSNGNGLGASASAPAVGIHPDTIVEEPALSSPLNATRSLGLGQDDLDEYANEDAEDEAGAEKRKMFSSEQMRHMVKHHAFSSGFQTYKQFIGKSHGSLPTSFDLDERPGQIDVAEQMNLFKRRPASAFGVEFVTNRDADTWQDVVTKMSHTHTAGVRSSKSEGALLRYAQNSVSDMNQKVFEDLGVDVSKVSLRQMKKASFIANLDVHKVSVDPKDPRSATSQAVKRLMGPEMQRRRMTGLVGAGMMAVDTRTRRGKGGKAGKAIVRG
mmetsp:Transcript_34438/g.78515  ORF Transcript_34438/g.78515 Transcript_34438/m.78515 type:complete len:1805 (+) Transcript_34438:111-5525(+)